MCGIYGIINRNKEPVTRSYVKTMIDTMTHRGPDGEGIYIDDNLGLGHKRLSIIDLDSGAQPMCNEDQTVWISFNGEIYNFKELRDELIDKGHRFHTHSDTEVIIHAYEEWKENVVQRLRGMFAFAIYDKNSQTVFLARDRLGIKPLVYFDRSDKFIFASEIKAIIKDTKVQREINHSSINNYFQYGYVPAPDTMFEKIYKLKPGHYLSFKINDHSMPEQQSYWNLEYNTNHHRSAEQTITELIDLLKEAIRIRLISDVPLGAFLSGGIDSSTIVRLMADVTTEKINTFSIGFEEDDFTETEYAKLIAEQVRSNHVEYVVSPDVHELLPLLVHHFDEPFSDSSAIPTYYVSKMARKNVTVALSGEGGDELFAGYDRYAHCVGLGVLDFIPFPLRKIVFGAISRIYPENLKGWQFINGLGMNVDSRFFEYMKTQYSTVTHQKIFSPDFINHLLKDSVELSYLIESINGAIEDPLTRYLDLDLRTYLPNDILTKTDITSMMNSLEVRVPILDHKLVEFVATIPSQLKFRNGNSKYILKKAMAKLLPQSILSRGKMGFGVPIRSWLANELRDITHHYLMNPSRMSGVLENNYVREIVEDNEKNVFESTVGGKLWWILFFEMWYQDVFRSK